MKYKVEITQIGNSLGIILSPEVLEKLRVGKDDTLYLTETQDGIELQPYDADFAKQTDLAESIMRRDRDALRKLSE